MANLPQNDNHWFVVSRHRNNRNPSLNEFKKLGYERYLICEQPRQDLDLCCDLFEKVLTQIYRALYGYAMLVPTNMGTSIVAVS